MPNPADINITVATSIVGSILFEGGVIDDTIQRILGDLSIINSYTKGTGDNQINIGYAAIRTLTGPLGVETIELDAGTLIDKGGNALNFATVKEFIVLNKDPAATNAMQISGDWVISTTSLIVDVSGGSGFVSVHPGGSWRHSAPKAGMTVTQTTRDQINVQSQDSATITYGLVVLGVSV